MELNSFSFTYYIYSPLHEKGLRSVDDCKVEEVSVVVTMVSPSDYDSELSPKRIIFIILGTIGFFITAVILLRNMSWMFKERNSIRRSIQHQCYCCGECCHVVRRETKDCCDEIQHYICPHRGFNLTGTSEEDDFDDFQTSMHYRGQHRTYIDDNDDERISRHSSDSSQHSSGGARSPILSSNMQKNKKSDYHKLQTGGKGNHQLREIYNAFTIDDDEEDDDDIVSIELTSNALHNHREESDTL